MALSRRDRKRISATAIGDAHSDADFYADKDSYSHQHTHRDSYCDADPYSHRNPNSNYDAHTYQHAGA